MVKRYAERVIPIIRANSPNAVVICGTPKWSADFTDVVKDPLTYKNILYTYHFYAASHYNYDNLQNYLDRLPVFVTEWGTCEYNGSGKYDLDSSRTAKARRTISFRAAARHAGSPTSNSPTASLSGTGSGKKGPKPKT